MFSFIFVGHISIIIPFHLDLWEYPSLSEMQLNWGVLPIFFQICLFGRVLTKSSGESERMNCLTLCERQYEEVIMEKIVILISDRQSIVPKNSLQVAYTHTQAICVVLWRKFCHN